MTLETQEECELPDYLPGQHIEIKAAIDGDVVRAYSLTGAARVSKRKHYSIAVRRQEGQGPDGKRFQGRMSCYINRQLKVGDLIELTAPSGKYVLPEVSQQPVILMAGGIGITPFMACLNLCPTAVRWRSGCSTAIEIAEHMHSGPASPSILRVCLD